MHITAGRLLNLKSYKEVAAILGLLTVLLEICFGDTIKENNQQLYGAYAVSMIAMFATWWSMKEGPPVESKIKAHAFHKL